MAAVFMGYRRHVQPLFELTLKEPGEDFGVGTVSGDIRSWPLLEEGEQILIGVNHRGVSESFYAVETFEDVNLLKERADDILPGGNLHVYAARRKHPVNLGKIED